MTIGTLLVANRGEIAVRIMRAARELGMRTVAAHSRADQHSLPVQLADAAIEIGPPPASKSYLNIEAILAAAKECGADAIHPGYGFLSENPDFAEAVETEGITFVGPASSTIRMMGDKVAARSVVEKFGIPTVAGSAQRIDTLEEAQEIASAIGFPVMVKAAAGGGGRGIRIAENSEELGRLVPQARLEANAAFGDGGIYLEKFIRGARHIEVQVLGDGENAVHCFERECSLQRRRQKVWEEAPATILPDTVRHSLCNSAAALARSLNYKGAGTLEFLYDADSESCFFLEMNTRIQVEHPVTEFITGVDLVREMLRIADGQPLQLTQDNIHVHGHAIECRINSEDPANNFFPSPGIVEAMTSPGGPGVRFDTMLFPGCEVAPYYDSLVGKLIAWDSSRPEALIRLRRALTELAISGVETTKDMHLALTEDKNVQQGDFDTGFLEHWLKRNEEKQDNPGG